MREANVFITLEWAHKQEPEDRLLGLYVMEKKVDEWVWQKGVGYIRCNARVVQGS